MFEKLKKLYYVLFKYTNQKKSFISTLKINNISIQRSKKIIENIKYNQKKFIYFYET